MDLFRRMELDINTPDEILAIDDFLPKPEDLPSLLKVEQERTDTVLLYDPMSPEIDEELPVGSENQTEQMQLAGEVEAADNPVEPASEMAQPSSEEEKTEDMDETDRLIQDEEFRNVDLASEKIEFELDDLPILDEEDVEPIDFGDEIDRLDL